MDQYLEKRTALRTSDGSHTLLSGRFGVTYHSMNGAIHESNHVYIEHGFLRSIAQNKNLKILEMGFGTGLNAFLSAIQSKSQGANVLYTAYEISPLMPEEYGILNYGKILGNIGLFQKIHEAEWNQQVKLSSHFFLHKLRRPISDLSDEDLYDLVYYDAFGPKVQPELWERPQMELVARAMRSGAILVTYCSQGAFRRTLKSLKFRVEKLPGPPGKREMTFAVKGISSSHTV